MEQKPPLGITLILGNLGAFNATGTTSFEAVQMHFSIEQINQVKKWHADGLMIFDVYITKNEAKP